MTDNIKIHNDDDFESMREAGALASECLDYITDFINPGISTLEIDKLCHNFQIERGAIPAPLNYKGFPKSICTSVNHVVCHGIPSNKILEEGDIINIDVTPKFNGWHGDTSRMFYVGKVKLKAQKLVETTYEAMMRGIEVVKPGNTTGDIGNAIQAFAEKKNYSVVRDFCGHGLGKVFHDQPSILHFGKPGEGVRLAKGMFFTIEPMINIGGYKVKILDDGWTAVTCDKSLSAQFEHSLGVTDYGYEIFTKSKKNLLYPPY
jgi:methionyl aminopeptidase